MQRQIQLKGKTYFFHNLECPDCFEPMRLRTGKFSVFYGCCNYPKCKGTHGAHPDGKPLGKPADKETRKARMRAHKTFDTLWKFSKWSRPDAYKWMQKAMRMTEEEAHIGNFSTEQCELLIELVREHKKSKKEIKSFIDEVFNKEE